MAKSKALVAAELKVAALEARLVIAAQVYRAQKAHICELESKLNTRGVIATRPAAEPVVSRYTKRDGSVWECVRTGNRAVSHQVLSN